MLKKTITYTDYDGLQRTEDHYFNISKIELIDMDQKIEGGMRYYFNKIINEQDNKALWLTFTEVISKAYGIKSPDGKRFIKSKEHTEAFLQTEAYTELMMELLGDAKYAAEFMNAVLPEMDNKQGSNPIPAPSAS